MKKFIAICSAVLAGTALLAFAGCDTGSEQGSLISGGLGGEGTQVEAGARDAYGVGAVTTAELLSALAPAAEAAPLSQVTEGGAAAQPTQEELESFNEYFVTLNTFLGGEGFTTTVVANPDADYAFDYKLTVEGMQLDGTVISQVMYYSEESVAVRPDDDDNERVETYRLTGVVILDGVSYEMSGYRSVETEEERDETEVSEELWIRASHPTETGTYVQMNLETGTEEEHGETETEREYVYSIYRGGSLVERASVDFETENENGRTATEYELGILRNGERTTYEVERAERANGTVTIGVNYRLASGERGRFVITQNADGLSYAFDDGGRIDFDDDRDDWDDHDDRDDWDDWDD